MVMKICLLYNSSSTAVAKQHYSVEKQLSFWSPDSISEWA